MLNKKTLTLKTAKTLDDAPLTPVDQTLRTPLDPPNQAGYFGLYNHPQHAELDDLLTDVDEPTGRSLKNYLLTFTPVFDQLVLAIYLDILLLPTTTPFLGCVPPLGLVSKVANETMILLLRNASDQPVYDTQSVLSPDFLRNHSYQPIILQLIRKRFLDLCAAQKQPSLLAASTSVLVPVSNSIYAAPGVRQLSILNLLLNELNVSSYQQQPSLAAQAAALSRLRLSSLNLRKHSLTRNNSYNGSNWLHVGNLLNIRPNASLGMHSDQNASTDSLQLMHDYVPRAFIQRNPLSLGMQGQTQLQPAPGGFNSMMLDYQTPPSSSKSSFSLSSTPNNSYSSYGAGLQPTPGSAGSGSEMDETDLEPLRSRSSSRGNGLNGSFPRPLTINTDTCNFLQNMNMHIPGGYNGQNLFGAGEALNSPFLSATTPSEESGYFGHPLSNGMGNTLPSIGGLRGGPLIPESPVKEPAMANGNNKINLPGQFKLSEKKRDSLKMKRGIH